MKTLLRRILKTLPREVQLDDVTIVDRHYSQRRRDAKLVREGMSIYYRRYAYLPDPGYGESGYCWRFGSTKINPLIWVDFETQKSAVELCPDWMALVTDEDIALATILNDWEYQTISAKLDAELELEKKLALRRSRCVERLLGKTQKNLAHQSTIEEVTAP